MTDFHTLEDHILLEQLRQIVRERWKIIELTTRYGWLAASFQRKAISEEDARSILILARKVGLDNCQKAVQKIGEYSRNIHPICIPSVALLVLNEAYTSKLLSMSKKLPRYVDPYNTLKDQALEIFTISDLYRRIS